MTSQDEALQATAVQSVAAGDGFDGSPVAEPGAVTGNVSTAKMIPDYRRRDDCLADASGESPEFGRVHPGASILYLDLHLLKTSYSGLRAADPRAEARLLASLGRDGQLAPIVVVADTSSHYEVIDGFRRTRGLTQLQVEVIAAIEWPTSVVDALLELRYTQGRPGSATPVEEGLLIATLVDAHGLSLADLAVRFGKSRTWVHNRLTLVRQLPEAVCRRVLSGELSGYVACKVVAPFARANSDWVEPFCDCVIDNGLTSRQAEALYQGLVRIPDPATRRQILDRPSRVLEPDGVRPASRRTRNSPDPLDVVERLERWCRQGRGLGSIVNRIAANGASEDTMDRLARVWQENDRGITAFVEQLRDLSALEKDLARATPGDRDAR